jgi:hypothetical protein
MKAPISDRVRRILNDPRNLGRELVKQIILHQRSGKDVIDIELGGQQYQIVRLMKTGTKPEPKS